MSKPKVPEYKPPAAAPAPISTEVAKRAIGGSDTYSDEKRKRRGRKSLRIDPQTGGLGALAGRAGINIPMK